MDYGKKMARYTKIHDIWVNLTKYRSHLKPVASGCLEWTGAFHRQGYGMIGGIRDTDQKRFMTVAHRVAMRLKLGRALERHEDVRHTCLNNKCCNPAHLYIRVEQKSNDENTNETTESVREVSTFCE